jgi:hypothetical protein
VFVILIRQHQSIFSFSPFLEKEMGNFVDETARMQQDVMNSILQEQSTACNATCTNNVSGNVVIVTGGSAGSIGIQTQSCTATANCLISNTIDSQIDNLLTAIAQQENTSATDIMNDLALNFTDFDVDVRQSMANYVTQITNSTCNATAIQNVNNNYVYAANATTSGFVGVQVGPTSANATCTMDNITKAIVYNQAQAQSTQKSTNIGMFALIFAVIAFVVVIGAILLFILLIGGGGLAAASAAKKKGQQQQLSMQGPALPGLGPITPQEQALIASGAI